jgi:predicted Ser/Thr protein kinase
LLKQALGTGEGSEAPTLEPLPRTPSRAGFVAPSAEQLRAHFPNLEILELLGQGGMGAVYKARQPHLDRLVALKILPSEAGVDPAFAERFTREARALARLNHPNIVTVYDFGQAAGLYYIVMEFVEGVNLRQTLRAGQLSPAQALAIVRQICAALQFAHDKGIVHRDIKPENILLDTEGRVKIADFGLAKILGRDPTESRLTGTGQVMGTFHYMAPEQLENPRAVDHRADIYSLGVVFYELLTGELPLGRFVPPSQKVQVDVRLDEVVLRTLEKEPERRYQKVSELRSDVETITEAAKEPKPAPLGEPTKEVALGSANDPLEQLILSHLQGVKRIAAVKVYREKTGASLAEAVKAVNAIAQKYGLPAPVPAHPWWRFLMVFLLLFTVLGTVLAGLGVFIWFVVRGLSPVLTWPIAFFFFILPLGYSAWRFRGNPQGRRLAFILGVWLLILFGERLVHFAIDPEPALQWLYQLTGVTPGPYDANFIRGFFGTVLAILLVLGGIKLQSWVHTLPQNERVSDLKLAQRQLLLPTIFLMATGIVQVLFSILIAFWALEISGAGRFLFLGLAGIGLVQGVVMVIGSVTMRLLKGYRFSRFASILAMVPLGLGWLLSFSSGLWALLILTRPETKVAFAATRESKTPMMANPGPVAGAKSAQI